MRSVNVVSPVMNDESPAVIDHRQFLDQSQVQNCTSPLQWPTWPVLLLWIIVANLFPVSPVEAQLNGEVSSASGSSTHVPAANVNPRHINTNHVGEPIAVASVEMAVYTAELRDLDLTAGDMQLDVIRRGTGPAMLDWSDVKVSINQLRWKQQPLLAGSTPEQQMVIFTDRDSDRLQGKWSAHGKLINQKLVFDLTFPSALNTRVILKLPADLIMEASQGVPQKSTPAANQQQEWVLELGNTNSTTLKIGPAQHFARVVPPRYEIETEHRARRDGIFLKADLTIDGPVSAQTSLQLTVSEAVEIQSVTIFSGSIQVGAALAFTRDAAHPGQVTIPLESLNLEPRFTLRLRGFQPVNWGEPLTLSRFAISGALETKRTVMVRVEPPLQLQAAEPQGMLQTSLTSEETAGEVWKYEAREPDSQLSVTIDLPRSEIVADISCLADARRQSGWAATVLTMHVENGTRFNATILLPEDWKLVSVAAGDAESRLASWTVDQRQLHVTWQNPMTSSSHRQLWLFARTPAWKLHAPTPLQIPQFSLSSIVSIQYQVLLPAGMELQIIKGEGWRLTDGNPVLPSLLRLREVSERLADSRTATCTTLRSANESRSGKTLVNVVPKSLSMEALTSQELHDSATTGAADVTATATVAQTDSHSGHPPVLEMELLTMAGPSTQLGSVHQAELRFDRPAATNTLNLKLPTNCKVSSVEIDGRSVTVFRKGEEIPLPVELTSISSLRLTYMTSSESGWLYQTNTVPMPRTSLRVVGFNWTLDLPRDLRLSQISLPGLLTGSARDQLQPQQYFGPLTRKAADRMFNPFSREEWTGLINPSRPASDVEPIRKSLQFIAPTVGETAQFITWNTATTRQYAWVALLGCLMIGSAARLFQIHWLRQIATIWLVILIAAAALAPAAWTLIFGGMFSGSLFSLLIPRRWMQNRDFLARPRRSPAPAQVLSTVTGLFLCATLPGGQIFSNSKSDGQPIAKSMIADSAITDAVFTGNRNLVDEPVSRSAQIAQALPASAETEVREQTVPGPMPEPVLPVSGEILSRSALFPLYLIESARYELIRLQPTPQIHSTFVVLTQPQPEEIFVRLPLQDVVFSSAAECLVNGEKQTLIPSLGGDAMVVSLQHTPAMKSDLNAKTESDMKAATKSGAESALLDRVSPWEWSRFEIQLDFSIRPGAGFSGPGNGESPFAGFQAKVPTVLDSNLNLPATLGAAQFKSWGATISTGRTGALVQLGGIGKLQISGESAGPVDALGASAITMLDVTPLRFKGQTRIVPGSAGWPVQLPLTFPAGCVISSITGSNVIDAIDAPPDVEATSFTLRLRPGLPALPVTVNFELPGSPLNPMELMIPAFPLWKGVNVIHSLGMTGPPTSALALIKTSGVVPLAPEEWPAEGDSGRGRPAVAVMLNSPQPVQLSWSRLNPVRTAAIAEQLTIQRESIEWSANVQMNVSQIPTFRHQFRVDPAVHIESVVVSDGNGGGEGGIRYNRTGNILSVFVPGGQLGRRTFQISGRVPLIVDAWSSIPTIEAVGTNLIESQLMILDRTGWDIELESSPGMAFTVQPKTTNSKASAGETRTVGIFRRDSTPGPTRLRVVVPADATRADAVLYLNTASTDHWEVITTFHLTAVESALKKAVFRVPAEMTGIRIRPSLYQYTSVTGTDGTIVTVKIPEPYSSSATITVVSRLSPEFRETLLAEQTLERGRPTFPLIEVLSAQKASQFVLVEPNAALIPAPTGSLRIDAAAFPAWAPAEWVRAVRDKSLVCYQQIRKDLVLVGKSVSELSGQPVVRLDETVVWPLGQQQLRGLTRLWLASKGTSQFRISHGAELSIDSVMTAENKPLDWTATPLGTILELPDQKSTSGIVIRWTRRDKQDLIRLLEYDGEAPRQRLLAVTRPDHWRLDPGTANVTDTARIWLARWDALLQCLQDVSGPLAVDSTLLNNIRLSQNEAARALEQSTSSTVHIASQQQEFDRLSAAWTALKDELIISGNAKLSPPDPLADSFTDLLEQRNVGLQVDWLIPQSDGWTGRLEEQTRGNFHWPILWGGFLVALAIGVVLRYSSVLSRLRDLLARHPAWSFMMLGLVWWLWLSPSVIGLLLILLTWSWEAVRWLREKMIKLWRKQFVST